MKLKFKYTFIQVLLLPTALILSNGNVLWKSYQDTYGFSNSILLKNIILLFLLILLVFLISKSSRFIRNVFGFYACYLLLRPSIASLDPLWIYLLDSLCFVMILICCYRIKSESFDQYFAIFAICLFSYEGFVWSGLYFSAKYKNKKIVSDQVAPLATNPNIYHVILDSFQSESLTYFFDNDNRLKEATKEFTFYPNFVANYIWTVDSMAALLSGKIHNPSETHSRLDWQKSAYTNGLWKELLKAGYRIHLYPNFSNQCVEFAQTCKSSLEVMKELDPQQIPRLFYDLLFLRSVPASIYNILRNHQNKQLPIPSKIESYFSISEVLASEYYLERSNRHSLKPAAVKNFRSMIDDVKNNAKRGEYVFVHSIIPHTNYELNEECQYYKDKDQKFPGEAYLKQARCAFNLVVELIEELKANNLYEESMILVHSDHGHFRFYNDEMQVLESFKNYKADDKIPNYVTQASSALLLIKYPIQTEPQIDQKIVHLPDLASTIAFVADFKFGADGWAIQKMPSHLDRSIRIYYRDEGRHFDLIRTNQGYKLIDP